MPLPLTSGLLYACLEREAREITGIERTGSPGMKAEKNYDAPRLTPRES